MADWTDLGGGWARDERGYTVRTFTEIEEVLAEHCYGWDREGRRYPFTQLTKRKLWADGGTFICNREGHLPDLQTVKLDGHCKAYRLRLVAHRSADQ